MTRSLETGMRIRIEAWKGTMATVALLFSFLCAVQDDLDKRINALIVELRSDDIAAREKATRDLMALGVDALPRLEKLQSASEGEVRARLGTAVERLRLEARLIKLAPPVRLVT